MSNKSKTGVAPAPNPFKPSFGSRPPVIVGRSDILEDVRLGLEEGPGSPNRAMTIVGPRGIGKTVVLEEINEIANSEGWISVSATTGTQMLVDILDQIDDLAKKKKISFPFKSLNLNVFGFGGGATMADSETPESGWRLRVQKVLETLEKNNSGLFITVDEVHKGVPELEYFCKAVQHFIRQGRNIGVAFAGLPAEVKETSKTPGLTFIWRAEKKELNAVPLAQVSSAFRTIIGQNGKFAPISVVDQMAKATAGYPFMIQLVGYHTWRHAQSLEITADDVSAGAAAARRRIGTSVTQYLLADLSPVTRTFLMKMAVDDGPSKMNDVANRMGVSAQYASVYRAKLIEAGIIKATRHGEVEFAIPYLKDYLNEYHEILTTPELNQ